MNRIAPQVSRGQIVSSVKLAKTVAKLKYKLCLSLLLSSISWAPDLRSEEAVVASIEASDIAEYSRLSGDVQKLIDACLELTRQDLAYTFGSASPGKGGMDCSGTICYLLKSMRIEDVPRMSHTIYLWAEEHGNLTRLTHVYSADHPVLRKLEPGDLVFWEGTYAVEERDPPISHVMLYLGTHVDDGKGILFGASSGRRYRGKRIHGVSVFDFKVPSKESKAKLVAFGPVPGIGEEKPKGDVVIEEKSNARMEDPEDSGSSEESASAIAKKKSAESSPPRKKPVKALLDLFSGKKQ